MSNTEGTIKIAICVPYTRTFFCFVNLNQKISVIFKVFPNIKCTDNLMIWYNGSQLIPSFTFEEVGIHDKSVIVIGIKTDDLSFNHLYIVLSKSSNNMKIIEHLLELQKNKGNDKCKLIPKNDRKRLQNKFDERKYFIMEKFKSLFYQNDFSKVAKKDEQVHLEQNQLLSSPLPVIF